MYARKAQRLGDVVEDGGWGWLQDLAKSAVTGVTQYQLTKQQIQAGNTGVYVPGAGAAPMSAGVGGLNISPGLLIAGLGLAVGAYVLMRRK
jgi:hypothetical protein